MPDTQKGFHQPVSNEGRETPPIAIEEIYIQTEVNTIRGELVSQKGSERTIRIVWAQDGVGVGTLVKFDVANMKHGKPMSFRISHDDGRTWSTEMASSNIERVGRWEKGEALTLDDFYNNTESHLKSASLPDNPSTASTEGEYTDALTPYEYIGEVVNGVVSDKDKAKYNFAFGNINEGWKIHLNVTPENVLDVSEYLKQNGYVHKYLTGGLGYDGKAFTIYFGAKSIMDKWVPQLSNDLSTQLCKPSVIDEIEIGSGVVGRFTAIEGTTSTSEYLQYGEYGMSARKDFIREKGGWKNIKTRKAKREVAQDAYTKLSQKYGSYFHG